MRTTSLPWRVMRTSSPASTAETSSEKFCLASKIPVVRIIWPEPELWPDYRLPLLGAVVRRLFGDLHVVDMALADARRRDLDELGALVHLGDRLAAAIAHRRAQAAGH